MINKVGGVRIAGYSGTWEVVDSFGHRYFPFTTLFVLESSLYGDEVAHVIVDRDGNLILENVWGDGYEEIENYYNAEEI